MINGRLNNDKQRFFGSWKVPPNVTLKIYTSGLIYRKMYAIWKEKVRSIAVHSVRSIAQNRSNIPRRSRECDDLGQRGDLGYTRTRSIVAQALNHGALDPGPHAQSQVRSIMSLCA